MTAAISAEPAPPFSRGAPAKLNLYFEILDRRPDGYHEIETVMTAISLRDRLIFHASTTPGLHLTCNDHTVPTQAGNSLHKLWEAVRRRLPAGAGLQVHLCKRIPHASGLGGASSDAATLLRALNTLFRLKLSHADALGLLAQAGSDTAFFWEARPGVCKGRGERVTPLVHAKPLHAVLAVHPRGIATPEAYRHFAANRAGNAPAPLRCQDVIDALADSRTPWVPVFNRLQDTALAMAPELRDFHRRLSALCGREAAMTGSGSGFFVLCESEDAAFRQAAIAARSLAVFLLPVRTLSGLDPLPVEA